MNFDQIVLLVAWFGAFLSMFLFIFWVIPTLIRLRFVVRAERLRDEAADRVLAGQLPASAPVRNYLRVQDLFINQARDLTIGRLAVAITSLEDADALGKPHRPSFAELTPDQRKCLNDLDRRSQENLNQFIRQGSPIGWAMFVRHYVSRMLGRKSKPSAVKPDQIVTRTNNEAWSAVRVQPKSSGALPAWAQPHSRRRILIPH